MATITQVKDRTTCSCTGMTLAALEVLATDGERIHEYRIRDWAYKGVWQLQELKDGATGMTGSDYIDLGEFPTQEAALAHIEWRTKTDGTGRSHGAVQEAALRWGVPGGPGAIRSPGEG